MPDIQMTSERNIQKTGLKVTLPQVQATREAELWQFCVELSGLAVKLEAECSPVQCTQTRTASEQWVFMRGVGTSHKECSVVDYTKHTADVAARLLNTKYFPNRVSIKKSPASKLCSVCQCIYKIFSHAYFYHRALFEEHEAETSMCQRFTSYIIKYNLMPKDSLLVPVIKDEDTEIRESEA